MKQYITIVKTRKVNAMYSNYEEVYDAIKSSPGKAKEILDAINTCIKRRLVIIMDDDESVVITGFSANKRNKRLIR
jgi:hypothetical protein